MPVEHYENFPVASFLLPRHLRRPIEAIYRFARSADDIADEGDATSAERLAALADYDRALEQIAAGTTPDTPVFAELATMVREHALPIDLLHDLISAFRQDVTVKRYPDFATLQDYCRRSANPVGRLLLHLFGRATPDNLVRSDQICTALQLANFWQDVAVDWQKDRVYLPQDELQRFNIPETQIAASHWTAGWAALMDFQVERTRQMMQTGAPLARNLPGRMGWEIRFTVQGGLRILERVQQIRGNVFAARPVLGPRDWTLVLLRGIFQYPGADTGQPSTTMARDTAAPLPPPPGERH